ncbi:hypothetical protein BVRB_2g033470 [Beta vulgaris subsp. vulgaris]|uniref:F-box/kelch-repeat protein At3g06240 n=1 Tax=Beta vulgaris subsp. vulgaris TaxID=3555 RepID=UPI00053FFDBC|nr:F-box/kelch-repeat protein At3g06240 [Beta vulgaris subsp. vulgaris]KMT17808.1 hypothetical protein BVRB_2g033470 [Beta vulgaris subsp. vulgaris]
MNPPKHMKDLHQEIIVDILTRLPTKSIGRFRCVSKKWKSLLSQPHFIKTQLNRTKHLPREEESLILFSDESESLYSTQLKNADSLSEEITASASKFCLDDHRFDSETFYRNMASCDGLILVKDEEDKLVLANPTTKETKVLPCSPYALDPRASFTMYGLGYDSVSDDYKVVTISYHDAVTVLADEEADDSEDETDCTEMYVNVYSVRHGNWKRAESSPYDHAVGHHASGVCVDGYIYWLASISSDFSSVIAAFDLGEEVFSEVPPPSSVDCKEFVFYQLVALEGYLCMFSPNRDSEIDFWVMKEYDVEESWTKVTIINPAESEFRPLCMLGKEQLVMMKDEETIAEKLVMYNMKEGTFKDIVVHGISDQFSIGGTFIESLLSPHCSNEDTSEG